MMDALTTYLVPVEEEAFKPLQAQLLQQLCQLKALPVAILYLTHAEDPHTLQHEAGSGFSQLPDPVCFKVGEGLLGQAALEKRLLTERMPASQLIAPLLSPLVELDILFWHAIPLLYQQQLQGLLVLSSATDLTDWLQSPDWQDFAHQWGTYLQSVRSRRYIQALLEKTQIQNQELASREEELRQNLEELAVTQEEMRRTQELLTERARWQSLVIDLFSLTSASTLFESGRLMRIFLAQVGRFIDAEGGLALWIEPETHTHRLLAQWKSGSISELWSEKWAISTDFLKSIESTRKTASVLVSELLEEGSSPLSGWLIAPFFDGQGIRGLLAYGFSELKPLSLELESALRSLAIAFFSAIERFHKTSMEDIPAILRAMAETSGGMLTFLSTKEVRAGNIAWLNEVPLVQRESYLAALRGAIESGQALWRPPDGISLREMGLITYHGLWILRLP